MEIKRNTSNLHFLSYLESRLYLQTPSKAWSVSCQMPGCLVEDTLYARVSMLSKSKTMKNVKERKKLLDKTKNKL